MRTNLEVYRVAHPAIDQWVVYFPWTTNPLPMNGSHGGWRTHSRKAKAIRDEATTMISYARIPRLERCSAQVTWWVTAQRVRDVDNLADLEKRLFDAIVLAKVIEDDRPELMVKPRAVIRPVAESNGMLTAGGFTLTITRLQKDGES